METPKEYYYTYYSYEEWGIGYIGSRGCYFLPEEDINYFGSFKDKAFKPTQKIILKSDYATREEAYADEIILQEHYKVVENPHFANRSYQTSTKFYVPLEQAIENGRKAGKKTYELGIGVFGISPEKRKEASIRGGINGGKIAGKISGKKTYELGIGIFGMSPEKRKEASMRGGINGSKKTNSQKWMCLETGFIANPGNLTQYQKARGIDTSKNTRRRIS
jgi:hypothetical protein